jgi:hypothetical protein
MDRHLTVVAAPTTGEPLTDAEGAEAISTFLRETAARMPVHSDLRALALRGAARWGVVAETSKPLRLNSRPLQPVEVERDS